MCLPVGSTECEVRISGRHFDLLNELCLWRLHSLCPLLTRFRGYPLLDRQSLCRLPAFCQLQCRLPQCCWHRCSWI